MILLWSGVGEQNGRVVMPDPDRPNLAPILLKPATHPARFAANEHESEQQWLKPALGRLEPGLREVELLLSEAEPGLRKVELVLSEVELVLEGDELPFDLEQAAPEPGGCHFELGRAASELSLLAPELGRATSEASGAAFERDSLDWPRSVAPEPPAGLQLSAASRPLKTLP